MQNKRSNVTSPTIWIGPSRRAVPSRLTRDDRLEHRDRGVSPRCDATTARCFLCKTTRHEHRLRQRLSRCRHGWIPSSTRFSVPGMFRFFRLLQTLHGHALTFLKLFYFFFVNLTCSFFHNTNNVNKCLRWKEISLESILSATSCTRASVVPLAE